MWKLEHKITIVKVDKPITNLTTMSYFSGGPNVFNALPGN